MATYKVESGQVGVHEKTLKAGEEMIVEFPQSIRDVEIENVSGTGRIYFTTDRTPATVAAPTCRAVPAALHAVMVSRDTDAATGPTLIRLISSADTVVSVTRLS